jgi:hypothetical protein
MRPLAASAAGEPRSAFRRASSSRFERFSRGGTRGSVDAVTRPRSGTSAPPRSSEAGVPSLAGRPATGRRPGGAPMQARRRSAERLGRARQRARTPLASRQRKAQQPPGWAADTNRTTDTPSHVLPRTYLYVSRHEAVLRHHGPTSPRGGRHRSQSGGGTAPEPNGSELQLEYIKGCVPNNNIMYGRACQPPSIVDVLRGAPGRTGRFERQRQPMSRGFG